MQQTIGTGMNTGKGDLSVSIQVWLLDLLWRVCAIIRFKKDSVNIWKPNVQLFPDSTSCQMMNFWRFCPRLKILLLFSLICENVLRILPRFVVLRAFETQGGYYFD